MMMMPADERSRPTLPRAADGRHRRFHFGAAPIAEAARNAHFRLAEAACHATQERG